MILFIAYQHSGNYILYCIYYGMAVYLVQHSVLKLYSYRVRYSQ